MNKISNRLTIEEHYGKQIIFVDYRGLKEKEMIELVNKHRELTLETKLPFLADFHSTYATPGYMVHAKRFVESTKNVIDKGALLGIDSIKSWILKGLLTMYNVNYKTFETADKAIEFLTNETTQTQNKN
jgi:hypothetical protein